MGKCKAVRIHVSNSHSPSIYLSILIGSLGFKHILLIVHGSDRQETSGCEASKVSTS